MTDTEKFDEICNLTTKMLKLPKGSLSQKSRIKELSIGRIIAGMIGLKYDICRNVISKKFNRNRTLTYYFERHHLNRCDQKTGYGDYAKNYFKIMNAYRTKQNKKKVFLENALLRNHLTNAGLSHSAKPTIEFTIISGHAKCKLLSDYSKFSIDYDTINEITKDYDCNFKWKEI